MNTTHTNLLDKAMSADATDDEILAALIQAKTTERAWVKYRQGLEERLAERKAKEIEELKKAMDGSDQMSKSRAVAPGSKVKLELKKKVVLDQKLAKDFYYLIPDLQDVLLKQTFEIANSKPFLLKLKEDTTVGELLQEMTTITIQGPYFTVPTE